MRLLKSCQNKYLGLIGLLFFTFSKLSAQSIDESFEKLTHDEKLHLEYFFDKAIKQDHLGHVLFFASKPASMSVIHMAENEQEFTEGWKVWTSKESLFQHPNFIIYQESIGNKIYIYFINKKTLLLQLSFKEEYLRKLFGESFSIRGLIEQLEHRTFSGYLRENQILLGILLGYGIESSQKYKQYITGDQQGAIKDLTGILCIADEMIETIQREENVSFCYLKSKTQIHPVTFIGDPNSAEVKKLKENYTKELEKIDRLYQKKDLLRTCLNQLCN